MKTPMCYLPTQDGRIEVLSEGVYCGEYSAAKDSAALRQEIYTLWYTRSSKRRLRAEKTIKRLDPLQMITP